MRYAFIEAEKATYPVRVPCRCLAVSRAGYYGWSGRGPSARSLEDQRLGAAVAAIFKAKCRRYGSPRVLDELSDQGERVSRKRVARLMTARGLVARPGRRRLPRTTDSRHGHPVAENGAVASMSRRGDCYDNAVAESFFSTLEHELGGDRELVPRAEVEKAVREYIDGFYNPERRHSTIGRMSPIAFEERFHGQRGNQGSGGSAPAPPRSSVNRRDQERPGTAA